MPLVVAHRGASAYEPENTLLAIKRAIELKADGIEVDVHQTKDKELVVIHDATVNRTTNGRGYIKDMTLEEIKKLFTSKGEKIPTLQEVIDLIKDKIYLEIEIKQRGIEEYVIDKIKENNLKNLCVTSIFPETIKEIKRINPGIKTGIGVEIKMNNIIKILKEYKVDKACINYLFVDKNLVTQIKSLNKEVGVWVVNNVEDIKKMIRLNVDQITTDKPDLVINEIKNMFLRTNL